MSEISARYDRLSSAFADKVAGVPADAWDAPSPCEGWSALDVARHVIEGHHRFLALVDRRPHPAPPADEDPSGAFAATRRQMLADLEDPARATETYEGAFGTKTFEWAVDTFLCFDLAVHGWDLAHATGQDEALPPNEIERLTADAEGWGDMARAPGVLGPALEPPEGADAQTRLLMFLGRQP